MTNERLGHILLKQGVVDKNEIDFCLSVQRNNGRQMLGQLLCYYNFAEESSVAQAIAQQVGWQFYDGDYEVDQDMVQMLGLDFLKEHLVFPVTSPEGAIFVLSHTHDTQTTDRIVQKIGGSPKFCVGPESRVRKELEVLSVKETNAAVVMTDVVGEEQLHRWLMSSLDFAIAQGASDFHIEPSQKAIEIRLRLDGILSFFQALPLKLLPRLINIIFNLAEVSISDFGHFHDARFNHSYLNRKIDIRVSHIPSVCGSSLVLRLLAKSKAAKELCDLGYGPTPGRMIKENLQKPDGISLIVGPTGCGKTTTLYAMLNSLKSIEGKIITIEDPIEVQLPLMTQVQINEKRGITFPQSVRAFLRHDPDVILIGEIRDAQTAQEALRAAMTGHQVFSTLHANRAFDAIVRLHDLGIPFLYIADHVTMIVAQRLVRKLCQHCKRLVRVGDSEELKGYEKYLPGVNESIFMAEGCSACRGGYLGQTVIAEVLPITERAGELIGTGDLMGLKKFIQQERYPMMQQDACRLVLEGVISPEEAKRVLG